MFYCPHKSTEYLLKLALLVFSACAVFPAGTDAEKLRASFAEPLASIGSSHSQNKPAEMDAPSNVKSRDMEHDSVLHVLSSSAWSGDGKAQDSVAALRPAPCAKGEAECQNGNVIDGNETVTNEELGSHIQNMHDMIQSDDQELKKDLANIKLGQLQTQKLLKDMAQMGKTGSFGAPDSSLDSSEDLSLQQRLSQDITQVQVNAQAVPLSLLEAESDSVNSKTATKASTDAASGLSTETKLGIGLGGLGGLAVLVAIVAFLWAQRRGREHSLPVAKHKRLTCGARIRIFNFTERPELNASQAVVLQFNAEEETYTARLANGGMVTLTRNQAQEIHDSHQ